MVLAAAGTAQRTARNAVRIARRVVSVVMSVTSRRDQPGTPSDTAPSYARRPTPDQTVQFNTHRVKRKPWFPKPRRLRPMTAQRYGTVVSGSVITTSKAPASDGLRPPTFSEPAQPGRDLVPGGTFDSSPAIHNISHEGTRPTPAAERRKTIARGMSPRWRLREIAKPRRGHRPLRLVSQRTANHLP